ncbi:RNA-guided endonuclease InsQ/TnpB family protein [Streptomyces sp. QTS52]
MQRELHKKVRGSANRDKVRQKIARLYALIGDVRRDMLDQFTTRLVRENQVLVVEDLAIGNLMRAARGKGRRRKAKLNEAILDAGWGELLRQLRYKCDWYGRTLVIVDRFFPPHGVAPPVTPRGRSWMSRCGSGRVRSVGSSMTGM